MSSHQTLFDKCDMKTGNSSTSGYNFCCHIYIKPALAGKSLLWRQFLCLVLIYIIILVHSRKHRQVIFFSFFSFLFLFLVKFLSRQKVLCHVLWLLGLCLCQSLSPSTLWVPSNSIFAPNPSWTCHYHCQGLKQAPGGYYENLSIYCTIYTFHKAIALQRNFSGGLYFHVTTIRLLDLSFDWNSCYMASVKAVFFNPTCS